MCVLMSDLVSCKFRKSVVMHDTECPYLDHMSLNNTNPNPSGIARLTAYFSCGLMSELVICKLKE